MTNQGDLVWLAEPGSAWSCPVRPAESKVLALRLHSNKRTMHRIDVKLFKDDPKDALTTFFYVEWIGTETLYFRLPEHGHRDNAFQSAGNGLDWREATTIRLEAGDYTYPGLELRVEAVEWLPDQPCVSVNDREELLECFTSTAYWSDGDWERCESEACNAASGFDKQWLFARLFYEERAGEANQVCYRRSYRTDIGQSQAIIFSATIDERAALDIWLTADGTEHHALAAQRGKGGSEEIRLPISGRALTGIRMRLSPADGHIPQDGQIISANFLWIMLERCGADPLQSNEIQAIAPIGVPVRKEAFDTSGLPMALVLNRDELAAVKQKLSRGIGRRFLDEVLRAADAQLDFEPEQLVGTYLPVTYAVERASVPWRQTRRWFTQLVYGGLAHLLTGDESYGAMVRRALLAAVRVHFWAPGFVSRIPVGLQGYRAPFIESHMAQAAALAYDFVYHLLSDEERREVEDAFHAKVVPWIDMYLRKYADGYLLRSNQGSVFSTGLYYACRVAMRSHPEAEAVLERGIAWLKKMLPFYYLEDGSTNEGVGYWEYATHHAAEAVFLMSRYKGVQPREFAHEAFPATIDFILHMRSLSRSDLGFLRIGDCMEKFSVMGSSFLFFARYFGDDRALWLWNEYYREGPLTAYLTEEASDYSNAGAYCTHGLMTLLWYDESDAALPQLEPARRFPLSDRIFLRTGAGYGDMLLFFEGGGQTFEHTHFDKGQFIFEAFGNSFAMDPGMIDYRDPSHHYYANTSYHNLVTAAGRNQSYKNASEAVRILHWGEKPGVAWVSADLANSYKELASYRRAIFFVKPYYVLVVDFVEAASEETGELAWHFHTAGTIRIDNDRRMTVHAEGAHMHLAVASPNALRPVLHEYRTTRGTVSRNVTLACEPGERTLKLAALLVPARDPDQAAERQPSALWREDSGEFEVSGAWGTDRIHCAFAGEDISVRIVRQAVGGKTTGIF